METCADMTENDTEEAIECAVFVQILNQYIYSCLFDKQTNL